MIIDLLHFPNDAGFIIHCNTYDNRRGYPVRLEVQTNGSTLKEEQVRVKTICNKKGITVLFVLLGSRK